MIWWRLAAASGAIAVGLGAFGAHGLRGKVDDKMMKTWETASHYHLLHSLALALVPISPAGASRIAGCAFSAGMLLFSGSLYALVLTENKKLGMITPVGGLSLIGGWLALALQKFPMKK
eukprot:CAMPEP_0113912664 /NCGR_PEP_ID=MMETSP0780_2-20120614/29063_1 /TAXON_ID=652834 /ORGANISM="Palpitomonas bilix" /LENGTH=118 /DNA_ID=CAMNT_0000909669 /DNA_START=8 /DNA_END=364 /DNA_ORIENTATION=+ /assembly_acc=CAM_ASM_000599